MHLNHCPYLKTFKFATTDLTLLKYNIDRGPLNPSWQQVAPVIPGIIPRATGDHKAPSMAVGSIERYPCVNYRTSNPIISKSTESLMIYRRLTFLKVRLMLRIMLPTLILTFEWSSVSKALVGSDNGI